MPVVVRGLANINAGFANTQKDIRAGWRLEQRHIAEPVAADAERLAMSSIRRMAAAKTVDWSRMRIGITKSVVYVAPRQKGTRGRGPKSRPSKNGRGFPDLMMNRAMQPALERHQTQIVEEVKQLLDLVVRRFN